MGKPRDCRDLRFIKLTPSEIRAVRNVLRICLFQWDNAQGRFGTYVVDKSAGVYTELGRALYGRE